MIIYDRSIILMTNSLDQMTLSLSWYHMFVRAPLDRIDSTRDSRISRPHAHVML